MGNGTSFKPARIRLRKSGTVAKTSYVNELTGVLNRQFPQYVTGGIAVDRQPAFTFMGVIVDAGPDDEEDYPVGDERYWVEPQCIGSGGFSVSPDHSLTPQTIITAVNLAEMHTSPANTFYTPDVGGGIHQLAVGTPVRVTAEETKGDSEGATKVYYTIQAERPPASYPVRLSQDGGGGGGSNTTPTWTYTATNLYGGVIDSGLTPENNRVIGLAVAAKIGFYVVNGTNQALWTLDELPDAEACT